MCIGKQLLEDVIHKPSITHKVTTWLTCLGVFLDMLDAAPARTGVPASKAKLLGPGRLFPNVVQLPNSFGFRTRV